MISHTAIILPEPPTNSLDGLSNKSGNKEGQLHNHPAMLYEPCIVFSTHAELHYGSFYIAKQFVYL